MACKFKRDRQGALPLRSHLTAEKGRILLGSICKIGHLLAENWPIWLLIIHYQPSCLFLQQYGPLRRKTSFISLLIVQDVINDSEIILENEGLKWH